MRLPRRLVQRISSVPGAAIAARGRSARLDSRARLPDELQIGKSPMMRILLKVLRVLVFGQEVVARPAQESGARTHVIAKQLIDGSPVAAESKGRRSTMNAAYEKLIQHLDAHDVRYLTSSDNHSIWADFQGEVGTYRIVAVIDEEDGLFQVFGHSPVSVPAGCRPAIAETVVRANCGMKVGKFEMHFDGGELRFQAAQILVDDCLEDATIERLMGTTMAMLNAYLPAFLSVIYGNELPADAVKCVESRWHRPAEDERGERRADD